MSDLGRVSGIVLVASGALIGCGDGDEAELFVELRTDLAPGFEFSLVRSELSPAPGEETRGMEVPALDGEDYFTGRRVADFTGVRRGDHALRVQALRADRGLVAERTLRLEVVESLAVVVLITRDCAGIECPQADDDPVATSCLGGTCTSPDCVLDEAACAPPECTAAGDCPVLGSCATPECASGRCLYETHPDTCAPTERCSVVEGCVERAAMDAGTPDAGMADAGMADAGTPDAGMADAGTPDAGGATVLVFGETPTADVSGVTHDTMLRNWQPTDNFGTWPELSTEGQVGQIAISLIQFDLVAIPASATVTGAELHLWTLGGASQTTFGYEVLEPWSEGTQSGGAGTANWTDRDDTTPWTNAGVGTPTSRSSTSVLSVMPAAPDTEYVVALPTPLVQRWVASSATNAGVALVTTSRNEAQFHSSESATASKRPTLRVELAAP